MAAKYEVANSRIKIVHPETGNVTQLWGANFPKGKDSEADIVTEKQVLDAGATKEKFESLVKSGALVKLRGTDDEETKPLVAEPPRVAKAK